MDLSEVSYRQAIADLEIANERILELSIRISARADEFRQLREELNRLDVSSPTDVVAASHREKKDGWSGPMLMARLVSRASSPLNSRRGAARKSKILWNVDHLGGEEVAPSGRYVIRRGSTRQISISGWAFPVGGKYPFNFIEVAILGSKAVLAKGLEPLERPDVGSHFGNTRLCRSGFSVHFSTEELPNGVYTIELRGLTQRNSQEKVNIAEVEIR
jgi:hypothetical protein